MKKITIKAPFKMEDIPVVGEFIIHSAEEDLEAINHATTDIDQAWLDGLRPLLSARAYSSALLTWMSHSTASLGDTDAFVPLLRAAFRSGRPAPLDVLLYLAVWLHPARVAATLSEWCQALRTRLSS